MRHRSLPGLGVLAALSATVVFGGFLFFAPHHAFAKVFTKDTSSTLTTNLLSYYRMEGDSTDYWGSATGTDTNVTYGSSYGKVNQGANYNGTSSVTNATISSGLSGDFSVNVWVKLSSAGGSQSLFDSHVASYSNYWMQLQLDSGTGRWGFGLYDGTNNPYLVAGNNTPSAGTWYMLTAVRDHAAGKMHLYVNGTEVSGSPITDTTTGTPTYSDFNFGARENTAGTYIQRLNGDWDEGGVWSKVLSAQEISDLYNGGAGDTMVTSAGAPYLTDPIAQYLSDGVTSIGEGGVDPSGTIKFGATLNSTSSSNVRLEVEVQPTGSSFTGTTSVTSAYLSAPTSAIATYTTSSLGNYHWRVRAADQSGNSSTWQAFGVDATSTIDFSLDTTPAYPGEIFGSPFYGTSSMTAYYRMQSGFQDYSQNGNNGTVGGAATTSGEFSSGYYFNNLTTSTGDTFPSGNTWKAGTSSMSIVFWLKAPSQSTAGTAVIGSSQGWDASHPRFVIKYNWTGSTSSYANNITPSYWDGSSMHNLASGALANNTWYQIAFVRDANSGVATLYVDGAVAASSTSWSNYDLTIATSTNNMTLGWWGPDADKIQIYLDDLAFFSRALSATEVSNLYAAVPNQFKSDATTTLSSGATTTESWVTFGAYINSTGTDQMQLQVEALPTSTNFMNTPNATSSATSTGHFAIATFASSTGIDLSTYPRDPEVSSNGSFHWQARLKDTTSGALSSWQTFGQTSNSTDFIVKTVPLYTQETSSYPSTSTTDSWATSTYDNAYPGSQCGTGANSSTIEACGCAITSVVMWLRYFGITTDTLGNAVNPLNLNNWLVNNSGYDNVNGGVLVWNKITGYASSSNGGAIVFDTPPTGTTSTSSFYPYINPLLSTSTPDPVILFEDNVPDGSATTTHWVVATGFANNAGSSTYTIRDSFWYNTQYLNQATSTMTAATIKGYQNHIDQIRVYHDPPVVPFWGEYHINAPNALMLVDSRGRRTGKNPVTGTIYHEIPNTGYDEITTNPGHPVGELFTSNLPNGQYTLYVLGGHDGQYRLYAANNQQQQTFQDNIKTGSVVAYAQNYDSSNLSSSTFMFEATSSSSAIITSAPPNNLPPPSLPLPPQPSSPPIPPFIPSTSTTPTSGNSLNSLPTSTSSTSTNP